MNNFGQVVTNISRPNSIYKNIIFPKGKINTRNNISFTSVKNYKDLFWITKAQGAISAVILCDLSSIISILNKNKDQNYYLYDLNKSSTFFLNKDYIDISKWNLPEKLINTERSHLKFEIKISKVEYLVTVRRTSIKPIVLISTVKKDDALSTINLFIERSLVFLIFAIAIAILIGLKSSNNFTNAFEQIIFATKKISEGDFNISLKINSNDEIGTLAKNVNMMSKKIANLMIEAKEKVKIRPVKPLSFFQGKQSPPNEAVIDNYQISGHCFATEEKGGDWWYYHDAGDFLYVWIGDITTHGVPTTVSANTITSIIKRIIPINGASPVSLINLLNSSLTKISGKHISMTLFVGRITKSSGEMTYYNASHKPPLLFRNRNNGVDNTLKYRNLGSLIPCESISNVYEECTIQLSKDDIMLMYTDGITEVKNKDHKEWGDSNFVKACVNSIDKASSIHESKKLLLNNIYSYTGKEKPNDDMTLFFLQA